MIIRLIKKAGPTPNKNLELDRLPFGKDRLRRSDRSFGPVVSGADLCTDFDKKSLQRIKMSRNPVFRITAGGGNKIMGEARNPAFNFLPPRARRARE